MVFPVGRWQHLQITNGLRWMTPNQLEMSGKTNEFTAVKGMNIAAALRVPPCRPGSYRLTATNFYGSLRTQQKLLGADHPTHLTVDGVDTPIFAHAPRGADKQGLPLEARSVGR